MQKGRTATNTVEGQATVRLELKQISLNQRRGSKDITSRNGRFGNSANKILNRLGTGVVTRAERRCGFIQIVKKNQTISDEMSSCRWADKVRQSQQKDICLLDSMTRVQHKRRPSCTHHIVIDLDQLRLDDTSRNITIMESTFDKGLEKNRQNGDMQQQIKNIFLRDENHRSTSKLKTSKEIRQCLMKPQHSFRNRSVGMSKLTPLSPFKKDKIQLKQKPFMVLNNMSKETNIIDEVLKRLFRKMTENNRPFEEEASTINLKYEKLSLEELSFISILFDRIEPSYLSAMNYPTFKLKALQKCPRDLQELLEVEGDSKSQLSLD